MPVFSPSQAARIQSIPHLAALRHRDYRNTWTANMLGGSAAWTFIVAISWLVLSESDSSGWVGVITFAGMLPFLLVSPIGGLMADRFDRRKVVLATFLGTAVTTSFTAALMIFGTVEVWQLPILVFAGGVLRAIQEPAIQALIPNQVPRKDLLNAITLNSATRHGSRFFGLLVAAPLMAIDFVGVAGVVVLSAVFQLSGAYFVFRARTVSTGEKVPQHGLARSMVDGLVYIYSHRTLAVFVVLVAFHCILVMSFDSILPGFSRGRLGAQDGSILGYLMMGIGAGSLVGTILIAGVRSERTAGQWLIWTGLFSGLSLTMLALSPNVPIAVLAAIGIGASQSTFMALTNTNVQILVPDRLRGRVSSLYTLHTGGSMAFANLGYGFLADGYSAPPILLVTGVLFIVIMSATTFAQTDIRRLYRTGQVATAETGVNL
jgi:MFS family permease